VLIQKNKIGQKWAWPRSRDLLLGPPNISGTAEGTNVKFYMQIDLEGY